MQTLPITIRNVPVEHIVCPKLKNTPLRTEACMTCKHWAAEVMEGPLMRSIAIECMYPKEVDFT